ncbi:HAD family hydrolase [Histomonas meleagridis]|uniref:HAD family hydrolase n=1 Tax=Histomonas meleagridis TaxID=135588 RepID=UPI00355ACB9C|nr:HAD family hydrolase [Histomonas meleagridis]KAH0797697.1 HAD family hydrolase [Histomonas meleagridis]
MKAALFDLDGVIVDSESDYTVFYGKQGELYLPENPNFKNDIKGSTLVQIFDRYFKGKEDIQAKIVAALNEFESQMEYPYIPGVLEFIMDLKKNGVKVAVVTSSNEVKMNSLYKRHPELKTLFDASITADKIVKSKPDPECYLKAQSELDVAIEDCYVFEDSFAGLESGRRAKMTVVGLSTTNPKEAIEGKCDIVIPDFNGFTYQKMIEVQRKE